MRKLKYLTEGIYAKFGGFEPYYHLLAVWVALVLWASFTYTTWEFAQRTAQNEARARFEFRASRIGEAIHGRMVDYEQILRGGAGLFAASEFVDRHEWRAYVEHLRIEEIYPGVHGISFAARVPAADKARHERWVRAQGFPDYAIRPPGERVEYAPITYVEPSSDRNLRALGYDMFSEPVRRAAMERARDSGEPAVSGRVTLVQETERDAQAGFLMYVPVYRKGFDTLNVAQRRAALAGYVYSPFRVNDLMRGILGEIPDVRLEIFDGGAAPSASLLYDSASGDAATGSLYEASATVPMRERAWTLRMRSLPAFENTLDRRTPLLVGATTGVISALVVAVIWLLATLRGRAVRLARSMTRDLRDSRERLALAIEGSNLALFDWNVATGRVVLSEQWSRILGGGAGSVVTTIDELEALVHPDDLPMVRQRTADLVRGRLAFYWVEHRVRTATGGWRWILSRAKAVEHDPAGRTVRIVGTNADITDRKEVERLKSEFIATVSHELRTPLTAIVGALGLLQEQAAGKLPPDAAMFLDMARQNSERLAGLINDILDIEKIESGKMEFRLEAVALRPFLEDAISMNGMYAERHGVAFRLEEPVPDAAVIGDRDRMLQVLTNLLSNAAKFSPHGETVSVSASARDGGMRVAVTDRGAGVPKSFHDRIFQKFAQADGSDTRAKGGTGLGLSISKAIVEKLGGTIGFESVPGQGATFYFELPLSDGKGRSELAACRT